MVEKPADVLRMDPAKPVKISGFGRLDATLRKIPGLGILIVVALLQHWGSGPYANGYMLLGVIGLTLGALAEEYLKTDKITATPAIERPSQPSA